MKNEVNTNSLNKIDLALWGFNQNFSQEAAQYNNLIPARIIQQQRSKYTIICQQGEILASVSGKFINDVEGSWQYPTVGDWVMVLVQSDSAVIQRVLNRISSFERKSAGRSNDIQVLAANIDQVFICMA